MVTARLRAFLSAWRLALQIVGLTFRAELEYRWNFLTNVCFGIAWQVSTIVFATVLLGRFPGMGGWSARAVLMVASLRMLTHGLFALFFDRHFQLATLVQEGRLDAFLLRPMPVYRQVLLSVFPTNALGDLLVGISMFAGATASINLHWTPLRIAYISAAVVGGTLMEGAIFTAISSLQLHFPSASHWSLWTEELMGTFGNYPLNFLPSLAAGALTYILPLAFIAYFPVAVLTDHTRGLGVPAVLVLAAPLIGLISFVASRLLWNASLRRYTGVSG